MICLIGQVTGNEAHVALIQQLQQQFEILSHISVTAEYFLNVSNLSPSEETLAKTLLQATDEYQEPLSESQWCFWIVPRLGTQSPWGSKALDIFHRAGLTNVNRLEKGFRFVFGAGNNISPIEKQQIQALCYDKMVEDVITDATQLDQLFQLGAAQLHVAINIQNEGLEALRQANQEYGLALSDVEMTFLYESFLALDRNPTDVELMMFSQINSEHCRHKVFQARWQLDHVEQPNGLFDMIKNTYKQSPQGILSAYKDNASVIASNATQSFRCEPNRQYQFNKNKTDILMKVETHNHPTAIEPYAGSGTGQGGEIRDEGATGRGSEPKAGLVGFCVSDLHVPEFNMPWERQAYYPNRIHSAMDIMLKAPIGGARFNNEFGRPCICGYFRTFEYHHIDNETQCSAYGFHKPVMIAGGMGAIFHKDIKKQALKAGDLIIILGGPGMKIGIGGGSASSMAQGHSEEALDFASVQRQNPEMQRRAQEVISACCQLKNNIIVSIHDVGAGGIANAISEIVHDCDLGVELRLEKIPTADPSMSPLELMCNESQERYIIAIKASDLECFSEIAKRERCPFSVVGHASDDKKITLLQESNQSTPVDLPLNILFADPPKLFLKHQREQSHLEKMDYDKISLKQALERVLLAPTVADKSFLITIGDRTVTGLVARDQMIGPWQVPVADCGVTASDYNTLTGEAMAIGEKPALSLIDPKAMARMAITEAILNILSADIQSLSDIKLSCNWMADAKQSEQAIALYDAVSTVGLDFCPELGIAVPVGKDSMSMHTTWGEKEKQYDVTAPCTLVVSAFAPVLDITKTVTPQLSPDEDTVLVLIDLANKKKRCGGSIFAQVTNQIGNECPDSDATQLKQLFTAIRQMKDQQLILAYHDKSEGGLWACLCEMAFSAQIGLVISLDDYINSSEEVLPALLNEEAGVVLQIHQSALQSCKAILTQAGLPDAFITVAKPNQQKRINIQYSDDVCFSAPLVDLHKTWSRLSFEMQKKRDNPVCAQAAFDSMTHIHNLSFDAVVSKELTLSAPMIATASKPKVAILREQGINGHREMAAAFVLSDFEAVDVTMQDLSDGETLNRFDMLVACGGFSYGDVLGAGRGWAQAIKHVPQIFEQFQTFFNRANTLSLGICNGCQMLAQLKDIIPGAKHWPTFVSNESQQFEARLAMVEVLQSPSILLQGMTGFKLPIACAHGEGQVAFSSDADRKIIQENQQSALCYIDNNGVPTENYPFNPNGSQMGLTGLTTQDGRVTIMMPHPERCIKTWQLSWYPSEWDQSLPDHNTPWIQMFYNARKWLDKQC